MTRYKNQPLFVSGPSQLHAHGIEQRHVARDTPGEDGAALITLGQTARRIDQTGTLLADTIADLEAQRSAIEAAMDGEPGELIDDLDRRFVDMVLLRFMPGPIRRIGPRLAVDYTASYSQVGSPTTTGGAA
jgi:hypothetical protein